MIYLSFNVPQTAISWRLAEMEDWKTAGKKFGVEVIPVSPGVQFNKKIPTAVFNMMGPVNVSHYRFLSILESKGVNVMNNIRDSSRADDKFLSSIDCAKIGIPVPKIIDLNTLGGPGNNFTGNIAKFVEQEVGYPCVIKMPNSGLGQGHYLIKSLLEFCDLYSIISLMNARSPLGDSYEDFFVQKFVSKNNKFSDCVRVQSINGEMVRAFLRRSEVHWKSNYENTITQTKAYDVSKTLDSSLIEMSKKICKLYNLKHAGIDFLETDNGWVLGEINTSPFTESTDTFVPFSLQPPGWSIYEELVKELLYPTT
jgi:glutathione synthase/RimK-type ligase-like ATP-grasp enzyme